jgi:hypothetical protein
MTADVPRSLVIESSPRKLLLLAGLGVLMTVAAIWVASLPDVPFYKKLLGGYIGTIFFGVATGVALWRLLTSRGPVITISPEGIRDTRIAASVIPWGAVTGISTWQFRRVKVMVLALRPGVEDQLKLTRAARWGRHANRAFGIDGLCITAQGLKIDYDTLLETTMDYMRAASRG